MTKTPKILGMIVNDDDDGDDTDDNSNDSE